MRVMINNVVYAVIKAYTESSNLIMITASNETITFTAKDEQEAVRMKKGLLVNGYFNLLMTD